MSKHKDCVNYTHNDTLTFNSGGKEQGNCHRKKNTIFSVYGCKSACKFFNKNTILPKKIPTDTEKLLKILEG